MIIRLVLVIILTALAMVSPDRLFGQTGDQGTQFFLTSFSPSVPGGFWIFTGDSPTNLHSLTGDPPVYQCSDFRDSSMLKYGGSYYVVFNDEQSNSCRIIVSTDMTNWNDYAVIFVPASFSAFWSPKFVVDKAGTIYLTAFVQDGTDTNFYMGAGIMSSDLTVLHDFRVWHLSQNVASDQTDPNSSAVYLNNGIYYLFTGDGNEYTSTDILADKWNFLEGGLAYGAGKSIAEWNGVFYLSATELGSIDWDSSTDLTNWTDLYLPEALTPQLGTIGREGCFLTVVDISAEMVRLTVARTGGNIVVSWPSLGSYTLQQSPDMSPGSWTPTSTPVATVTGTNSVTMAAPPGTLFFRLAQ